jgi:hypothetical protein
MVMKNHLASQRPHPNPVTFRAVWTTAWAIGLSTGFVFNPQAMAGPMGFKGSTMVMGDFSPNWQETWVNYALTARDAIGVGGVTMRSDDKRLTREAVEVNVTRLLSRWNMPEAQANLWLTGGMGTLTGNNLTSSRLLLTPGMQLDYETTRVYFSANARLYRAKEVNHDYASVRAGFSLFEADYDETQPWVIVELRRMRGLSGKTEITPMLRLIHQRYFIELGISRSAQVRFNLMYIF